MSANTNEYKPQTVTHPGLTLAEKLQELGMGHKEFAVKVGKPEKTITAVTKGESAITTDMAVSFENVLLIPASFWLSRQSKYEENCARIKRSESILAAIDWAKKFPYSDMAKMGWVQSTRKLEERVEELFRFFGVSNQKAWESYYINKELKVNFRISLAHTNQSKAVAAWLRKGELQAKEIEAPRYDVTLLRKALPELKDLMVKQPASFFKELQAICLNAGLIVVYTPNLPKAPIHGATRWLGNTPFVQLSARYKANDRFWFTFFHELGHIFLHGKKYISIENIGFNTDEVEKEDEADAFAVEQTFNLQAEQELLQLQPLTKEVISSFAANINTHPAVIIGRLQYKKVIKYNVWREFIVPIDLDR